VEIAGGLDAREDELPERLGGIGHVIVPWLVEGRFARGEISDARLMDDGRALGKRLSLTRHRATPTMPMH
jgi:hypothetical protein